MRTHVALLLLTTALLSCGTRAGPDWLTGDCKVDHEETERRLDALADSHATPCTTVSDCEAVQAKLVCQDGHVHALSKSALSVWEAERQSLEADVCPYLSTACTVTGDSALRPLACESGTCVLK